MRKMIGMSRNRSVRHLAVRLAGPGSLPPPRRAVNTIGVEAR
jgi:hypothetical protein